MKTKSFDISHLKTVIGRCSKQISFADHGRLAMKMKSFDISRLKTVIRQCSKRILFSDHGRLGDCLNMKDVRHCGQREFWG